MRKNKGFTLIELMIVIAIIAIIAAIAIPGLLASQRASNERNASASLKTIATAQADFRANDRDGDKIQNFWTGDVAGLYCIKTTDTSGQPNKLIELSVAAADGQPIGATGQYDPAIGAYAVQGPKAGYWYWALTSDATVTPAEAYKQAGGSPAVGTAHYHSAKFGFLAYPDSFPSSGKIAFILNEGNTMFKRQMPIGIKPTGVPGAAVTDNSYTNWPSDGTLKNEWSKMD